jgi:hypothetical protein
MYCELTPRQRYLYKALRANSSVAELLRQAANFATDAAATASLMNLVMQFRKVRQYVHHCLIPRSPLLRFATILSSLSERMYRHRSLSLLLGVATTSFERGTLSRCRIRPEIRSHTRSREYSISMEAFLTFPLLNPTTAGNGDG